MSQQAFERGDWAAVIDAHPLESHDPAEWLRYGAALLRLREALRQARCCDASPRQPQGR